LKFGLKGKVPSKVSSRISSFKESFSIQSFCRIYLIEKTLVKSLMHTHVTEPHRNRKEELARGIGCAVRMAPTCMRVVLERGIFLIKNGFYGSIGILVNNSMPLRVI